MQLRLGDGRAVLGRLDGPASLGGHLLRVVRGLPGGNRSLLGCVHRVTRLGQCLCGRLLAVDESLGQLLEALLRALQAPPQIRDMCVLRSGRLILQLARLRELTCRAVTRRRAGAVARPMRLDLPRRDPGGRGRIDGGHRERRLLGGTAPTETEAPAARFRLGSGTARLQFRGHGTQDDFGVGGHREPLLPRRCRRLGRTVLPQPRPHRCLGAQGRLGCIGS